MAARTGFEDRNDFLVGTTGADQIYGLSGNDTLEGQAGDDVLQGGAGADSMSGGSGNDTYWVDSLKDKVVESGGDTRDVVVTSIGLALPANVEVLQLQAGAGGIDGTGNKDANEIIGNEAANVLDGQKGSDTLRGGAGSDTLLGGAGADVLAGGAGADVFLYRSDADSTSVQPDRINDLGRNGDDDRIDLSQLDPDVDDGSYLASGLNSPAGAQGVYDVPAGFQWLGGGAFTSGAPGQARYDAASGMLQLSNDADADAEFAIEVGTGWTPDALRPYLVLQDTVAPAFTAPAREVTAMVENRGAGVTVYDANADDPLASFLLEGTHAHCFSISPLTGAVKLAGNADYESAAGGVYHYTVVVVDHAGNRTEVQRSLAIGNLDEVAPRITSLPGAADENQNVVYDFEGNDDGDTSAGFQWSITGADAALLEVAGGAVRLRAGVLDAEGAKTSYSFTLVADDQINRATKQIVTVQVRDLDEAAPVITSGGAAAVDENVPAGTLVYTATATDTGDVSAGVTFSLGDGAADDSERFDIDPATGRVSIDHRPDFEAKDSYTFTVIATDGAGLAATRTVTLSVGDVEPEGRAGDGEFQVAYMTGPGVLWGWASGAAGSNERDMDLAFGAGAWDGYSGFEGSVLSAGYDMIFMDGGDYNFSELAAFLDAHREELEAYVTAGGLLFVNAARNEMQGSAVEVVFGANLESSFGRSAYTAVDASHPIVAGPYGNAGAQWSGSYFAHDIVTGADVTALVTNERGETVLGELAQGDGHVLLGGMTLNFFQVPDPQTDALRVNTLLYLASFSPDWVIA